MAQENTTALTSNKDFGKATSWANRVVTTLLTEYSIEQHVLPRDFILDGVNIVRLHNGKISVGFVFSKEAQDGTR